MELKKVIECLLACGETIVLTNGRGYFVEIASAAVGGIGYYDTAGKFYSLHAICAASYGLHTTK